MVDIDIITCPQWKARKPKSPIQTVGHALRFIIHHTASHHAEISNPRDESVAEAIRFARNVQTFHMDVNGWIDSGHNFLVTRAGHILQGRWITVAAIEAGHMVLSAHCPTQNMQIGIEHEHKGHEPMTDAQRRASARLQAWCSMQYNHVGPLPAAPHKHFYNTACPANLEAEIPHMTTMAAHIMREAL